MPRCITFKKLFFSEMCLITVRPNLITSNDFHSLESVDCVSEIQLQVADF